MSGAAGRRLSACLAGTPLEPRFSAAASVFLERRAAELERLDLAESSAAGLARLLASNAEFARYLSLRPELLPRLAEADADSLRRRRETLAAEAPRDWSGDLEGFLDALRLFRRDETAYAAHLDFAGLVPFEEVSSYLSLLAEVVVERALVAARDDLPGAGQLEFSVLCMGKLAGRELTYHSDLDLIFLYGGDIEQVHLASRLAQRMIHYLSTPTGAGTAYTIDARLRPSGGQGTLVTSYDAYEAYQQTQAQTWEHLALMRCRALAGDRARAAALLQKLQIEVCARRMSPWSEVAELRRRVASERTAGADERLAIKTGAGGIMDVDFLAKGAQLECAAERGPPALPAVPAMLRSVVSGPRVSALLEGYHLLRALEARARWVAGRPVERLDPDPDGLAAVAELLEPGLDAAGLLTRSAAVRAQVIECCDDVIHAGTISALAG